MIKATNLDPTTHQPTYGGNGSVILVKVDYAYSSTASKLIVGDIAMSNLFFSKPRRVASIAAPTACS